MDNPIEPPEFPPARVSRFRIRPNVQYVHHPGGGGENDDVLAYGFCDVLNETSHASAGSIVLTRDSRNCLVDLINGCISIDDHVNSPVLSQKKRREATDSHLPSCRKVFRRFIYRALKFPSIPKLLYGYRILHCAECLRANIGKDHAVRCVSRFHIECVLVCTKNLKEIGVRPKDSGGNYGATNRLCIVYEANSLQQTIPVEWRTTGFLDFFPMLESELLASIVKDVRRARPQPAEDNLNRCTRMPLKQSF